MRTTLAAVDVGASIQRGLDNLIGFLPNLIGFLIILAIGYIVARVVKGIVTKLLEKIGTDRALHSGSSGEYVDRYAPGFKPSSAVGAIAFWFLFLGALAIAVSQLGISALDNFIASIVAYLPNVLAAVLILVVAEAYDRERESRGSRRFRRDTGTAGYRAGDEAHYAGTGSTRTGVADPAAPRRPGGP